MKKIISMILCLALLMGLAVGVSAADYAQSEPQTNKAYKLGVAQNNVGKQLYFAGTSANTSYYLATTEDFDAAVDVYVESVNNGYRMYFTADGTKTYIDIIQNGTYVNLDLNTNPTAVYTWNNEYDTFTTTVGETEYYMGTYNAFETLSASKISYIGTSFPCHLYTKEADAPEAELPEVPESGSTLTIAEAKEYAAYTFNNVYTITGTITAFEGDSASEYGNCYIEDETGSIYVYGIYSEDGQLKYGELDYQPQVGDTITVTTKLSVYNEVPQLKSAWLQDVVKADADETEPEEDNDDPTEPDNDDPETTEPDNNDPETTEPDNDDPETTEPEDDKDEPTDDEDDKDEPTDDEDDKNEPTDDEDDKDEPADDEDDKDEPADDEDDKDEPADDEDDKDEPEETKPVTKPVTTITTVSKPSTGVAYKLGLFQENLEKNLYFTGEMAGYYLATGENYADGVDVYVEAVEGGYRLYFTVDGVKTYIDTVIATGSDGREHKNLVFTTEPTAVYTWNDEYDTFITKVGDYELYMGTYNEYSTLSASETKYLESSFPCHLYIKTTTTDNVGTGDTSSVFVAMMVVAAVGAGILVSKKKEF